MAICSECDRPTESVWTGGGILCHDCEDAMCRDMQAAAEYKHTATAEEWLGDERSYIRACIRTGETLASIFERYQGDGATEDMPIVTGLHDWLIRLEEEVTH